MKKQIFLGITVIIILLIVNITFAGRIKETFEKTLDLKSGGIVILRNTNGTVNVNSWGKEQIRIFAEKTVRARNQSQAERIMKEVEIIIERSPDRIEIESDYPRSHRGSGSFWDLFFGDSKGQISIVYELTVPRQVQLDLKTTNGSIAVETVSGEVRVRTTNGSVKLLDTPGTVYARTTNGRIQAEITKFTEDDDIDLKTTNGAIKLYLPESTRADIRATTTNGSISTDFPLEVSGRFTRKRLRGSINGGGGKIDLDTTNGSIRILQR